MNYKPLHTTVSQASEGDSGWIWFDKKWRPAQVTIEQDDRLYVDILGGVDWDHKWFEFEDTRVKDLPWYPVNEPPYQGDKLPCTHAVTIQDAGSSTIISWTMNETDGKKSVKRVADYLHAMLQEQPQ